MKALDIRLLGEFSVAVDGEPVPPSAWPQRRAADLVKLLALAPGHRKLRDAVVEALWPHLGADAGAANLHKAAHYARRALGAREAIVVRGGTVALAPGASIATDVARLEAGDEELAGLELLPEDRYEAWTVEPRERLRERTLALLRARGRWADVLELEPADEEAHRELIRSHAEAGDRAAAIRQFARLREHLSALGLQPSGATVRLYRALTRGAAVTAPPRTDVPAGAERPAELAAALERLHAPGHAGGDVVLLTGPPGAGKTGLAEDLLADAGSRGRHTLRGVAAPGADARPFAVLVEAVEPLVAARPALLAHLGDEARATIERLAAPPGDGPAPDRRESLVALGRLLLVAARERGCALLLDDLHLAGDDAAGVLAALCRVSAAHPLLAIACWRPDEAPASLSAAAGDLARRRLARRIALAAAPSLAPARTRYATSGARTKIAYQVIGDGPADVVVVPGFVSNVEQYWEMPVARRLFERLAARARVVVWDKRGTGLSDPVSDVPTMDERIEDMTAVMAAAGCERPVILGISEGGAMAITYAARAGEAVRGLALYGATPRFQRAADYPAGWATEDIRALLRELDASWGEAAGLATWAPSLAGDPEVAEIWGRYQRAGASPGMARAVILAAGEVDVRDVLEHVKVPTLIVHRVGDRVTPIDGARLMAERIPQARLVELPGDDHFPFVGDMERAWEEIERFVVALTGGASEGAPDRRAGVSS